MITALLVVASPFGALALQRWRLLGPPGSSVSFARWAVVPLAALSLAAGIIHVAVTPAHLAEDVSTGGFFPLAATTQFVWAWAFARRPGVRLAAFGLVANAAVAVVWLVTRTTGLPFGAHPFVAEVVGVPDLVATAAELLIVAGTAVLAVPRLRVASERRYPVGSADLALVCALVAVAVATGFALAEVVLTGGHAR